MQAAQPWLTKNDEWLVGRSRRDDNGNSDVVPPLLPLQIPFPPPIHPLEDDGKGSTISSHCLFSGWIPGLAHKDNGHAVRHQQQQRLHEHHAKSLLADKCESFNAISCFLPSKCFSCSPTHPTTRHADLWLLNQKYEC